MRNELHEIKQAVMNSQLPMTAKRKWLALLETMARLRAEKEQQK